MDDANQEMIVRSDEEMMTSNAIDDLKTNTTIPSDDSHGSERYLEMVTGGGEVTDDNTQFRVVGDICDARDAQTDDMKTKDECGGTEYDRGYDNE